MGNLILNSLEIHNFRAFRSLRIEKLGRVNLIVGKNNVGKTCLLEALLLYANPGDLLVTRSLLGGRDEIETTLKVPKNLDEKGIKELLAKDRALVSSIKNLFYGRGDVAMEPIQIGSVDSPDTIIKLIEPTSSKPKNEEMKRREPKLSTVKHSLEWQIKGKRKETYSLEGIQMESMPPRYNFKFISANGLPLEEIADFWDKITLTKLQDEIVPSLQLIAQGIEKIDFKKKDNEDEIPYIRLKEQENPIPLRSLGGGMFRLLGLVLALVNAKNGLLLIDEIDTGLHYSVQKDVWRLILKMANRLNIQVFATTHSWDCVESFQKAVEDSQEDVSLISLRQKKDKTGQILPGEIVAVLFDKEELPIVAQERIEVR